MRKLLPSILAVIALLGTMRLNAVQAETKTVLTASFAGYDKLLADIDAIGRLGGSPDLGKGLDMMLKLMTQGKGLAGLDVKRPWGAVVLADDQKPFATCGFLPVSDLKALMDLLKSMPQLAKSVALEGEVYVVEANNAKTYLTQKGGWAIVSDKRENLALAPSDPLAALGDLPQRYDLAFRASVKNLPKEFRDQLLIQLRAGAEVAMQQAAEDEETAAARQNMAKQTMEQLTMLVHETDSLLLGWNVDAKNNSTYLDLELTAQPGAKLAQQFAEIKPGPTNLAGVRLPDAAVTAGTVGMLTDAQAAQAKIALSDARKQLAKGLEGKGLAGDQLKLALKLLGDVFDVLEKTIETKKTDAAIALVLRPEAVTLVGGAAIAEGAKLDAAVKQLLDEVQKNADAAKSLKLAAETHQDVRIHVVSMPTPAPDLAPFVGERLEAAVGIADDRVLAAVGRDALKTLKSAIDASKSSAGMEVPPLELKITATPIAAFFAQVSDEPQIAGTAATMAALLKDAAGKDHITLTSQPVPQGVRIRLEVEEGLLKVLGAAMSPMAGGLAPANP